MVLQELFLTPLGFVALLTLIPVILLYLIRPDPRLVELPTLRFLAEERTQTTTNPLWEQLRRNLLLLLQLLVLTLLALSLATPYVAVSESAVVEETVLVVDGSASMTTQTDGTTRFAQAVSAAREKATQTNSVVLASADGRVVLRGGGRPEMNDALDSLRATESPGDLQSAIAQAAAIAGENAQIVVLSDFADETAWGDEVEAARAQGHRVELVQFNGGGADNVGIISRSFSGQEVTVSVKNYGSNTVDRTLSVGSQRQTLSLAAGDVGTATFTVPPGGDTLQLTPGDSFTADDIAYLAAPEDAKIDVLVLTNDRNVYLTTALSVIDEVSLTVKEPPTTVTASYDVIIYSNVEEERLLRGNVEAGRDVLARGGGVAITAQSSFPDRYGDLLLIEPGVVRTNPAIGGVAADELTRDILFPPPDEYVSGTLREGASLVQTNDGSPILATSTRGNGRVLYYGYIEESSAFKFNYQYPVFWKRAVFYLAGRDPLPVLNRQTGQSLQFTDNATVQTPDGTVTGSRVPLDQLGYYTVGNRRIGVSLFSTTESNVAVPSLDEQAGEDGVPERVEEQRVPFPLTAPVAVLALVTALAELFYLRRRGDL